MLMVLLPMTALTLWQPVGLGGRLQRPPKELHCPTQRIAAAGPANFCTASSKVTSLPLSVQAQQVLPPKAVGTAPSTTSTYPPVW